MTQSFTEKAAREMDYVCRARTDAWSLWTRGNGAFVLLVRASDGASAHFQGDDADLWDRNMDAIESIDRAGKWGTANTFESSFNLLCDGYSEVLKPYMR
jgi:hypothetical protein